MLPPRFCGSGVKHARFPGTPARSDTAFLPVRTRAAGPSRRGPTATGRGRAALPCAPPSLSSAAGPRVAGLETETGLLGVLGQTGPAASVAGSSRTQKKKGPPQAPDPARHDRGQRIEPLPRPASVLQNLNQHRCDILANMRHQPVRRGREVTERCGHMSVEVRANVSVPALPHVPTCDSAPKQPLARSRIQLAPRQNITRGPSSGSR